MVRKRRSKRMRRLESEISEKFDVVVFLRRHQTYFGVRVIIHWLQQWKLTRSIVRMGTLIARDDGMIHLKELAMV